MKLAFWIAMRYLWRGRNRYTRLINWITLCGLGLGVLVLTVVVSIMNGFDGELRGRILGVVPHAVLPDGSAKDLAAVASMPDITAAHHFFSAAGMILSAGNLAPVAVHGLDPMAAVALTNLEGHMLEGELEQALSEPNGLVLGLPLARSLGLQLGDAVLLILPEAVDGSARPRFKRYRLSGAFALGAEFDYGLAIVARQSFSELERQRLGMDGIRVALREPLQAERFAAAWRRLAEEMSAEIGAPSEMRAPAEIWTQTYGELFQAVRIEKTLMFLILLLVVAVAGFNIISSQTMTIDGKRTDIAVLRTMGATGALVRRVFLLQGIVVASLGIALGLALGVVTALNIGPVMAQLEAWFGFHLLQGTYFDVLPSRVLPLDLAVVGGASWLLCLLAAWVPARRAAEQPPVQGLHS